MACRIDEKQIQDVREELQLWRDARRALALGGVQSYTIHNRSLTRLNLKDINDMIDKLENELDALLNCKRSRVRTMAVIPRDY